MATKSCIRPTPFNRLPTARLQHRPRRGQPAQLSARASLGTRGACQLSPTELSSGGPLKAALGLAGPRGLPTNPELATAAPETFRKKKPGCFSRALKTLHCRSSQRAPSRRRISTRASSPAPRRAIAPGSGTAVLSPNMDTWEMSPLPSSQKPLSVIVSIPFQGERSKK